MRGPSLARWGRVEEAIYPLSNPWVELYHESLFMQTLHKSKPSHVASYCSRTVGVEVFLHCSLSVDWKIQTGDSHYSLINPIMLGKNRFILFICRRHHLYIFPLLRGFVFSYLFIPPITDHFSAAPGLRPTGTS